MALKKTIQTQYGVEVKNAYCKVSTLTIIDKIKIGFNVASFADVNLVPIVTQQYICNYDINGENPIKQAYLHLKTLPEFADAVDC
jgi:hypothetical protein